MPNSNQEQINVSNDSNTTADEILNDNLLANQEYNTSAENVANKIRSYISDDFKNLCNDTNIEILKLTLSRKEFNIRFKALEVRKDAEYRKFEISLWTEDSLTSKYNGYIYKVNYTKGKIELVLRLTREDDTMIYLSLKIPLIEEADGYSLRGSTSFSLQGFPDVSFLASGWFPSNTSIVDKSAKWSNEYEKYSPKFSNANNQWLVAVPPLVNENTIANSWGEFCIALAALGTVLGNAYDPNNNKFPYIEEFKPKRPIDLSTDRVQAALNERGIFMPWHIVETACASLNAKKHIIFTGPPGCGKTSLAKVLAELAGISDPLIVTASPTWSTDELIGRYMPDMEGKGIRFAEGFFLRAIKDNKWLIIDELNRADIDSCFGELFTVLSGQPAMLPFEKTIEDNAEDEDGRAKPMPIVVLPEMAGKQFQSFDGYPIYSVQSKFRIIGTMNDADASRLNQLSYAFQRRFNIIRIDAPNSSSIEDLINNRFNKNINELKGTTRSIYRNLSEDNVKTKSVEVLFKVFATNGINFDLIKQKVVGVAQVLDVIDFIIEGVSSERGIQLTAGEGVTSISQNIKSHLIKSYVAMALTMSVFPQLMALTGYDQHDELEKAVKCILDAFNGVNFYRIEKTSVISDNRSIQSYLKEELKRLFRHVHLHENIELLLSDDLSPV